MVLQADYLLLLGLPGSSRRTAGPTAVILNPLSLPSLTHPHNDTTSKSQAHIVDSMRLTLQPHFIPLQTLHSLLEQLVPSRCLTRDIVLLELYGYFELVEYVFNGVGEFFADTVTWDEGYCIFA